jgi:hypothetical protein
MNESHIIALLEERPLGSLSETELEQVKTHTAACPECLGAYHAAQASLMLLQERASVLVVPTPFFQTRVLAAIRERNLASKRVELANLWRTARPLVASMGAFVVMLLMLTFFADSPAEPSELASMNEGSPEWVMVEPEEEAGDMTYGQAIAVLYDPALEGGDTDGK